MEVATLVIAVSGVLLAALSLGWQAASHVLTGGRVKVALRLGAIGDDGRSLVSAPPSIFSPESLKNLAEQGYRNPVVVVEVRSVGRLPVTVVKWSLRSARGVSLSPIADSIGPPLPHRLDVGESAAWAVDMRSVQAFAEAVKTLPRPGLPTTPGEALRAGYRGRSADNILAVVELGDGRTRTSPDAL